MTTRSAWREPMVWLVIALPLATVLAGVATVAVGLDAPDATGADAVRRTGQQQTLDIAPDLRAAEHRLAAQLDIAGGDCVVALNRRDVGAPAVLELRHPTDAARDHEIELAPRGNGFAAACAAVATGHWNVVLASADRSWRLVGRLEPRNRAVLLPRFADTP